MSLSSFNVDGDRFPGAWALGLSWSFRPDDDDGKRGGDSERGSGRGGSGEGGSRAGGGFTAPQNVV